MQFGGNMRSNGWMAILGGFATIGCAGDPWDGGAGETTRGPEFVEMVAARDGAELRTKVFLPAGFEQGPAVLLRTPYRFPGDANDYYEDSARFFVSRGLAFVLQDCRGRIESEGAFEPFADEIDDGNDTVDWILEQPWSNGRVGTIGGSYNGYTALAAAVGHDAVKVIIADDAAKDLRGLSYAGGIPTMFPLKWLHLLEYGEWGSAEALGQASNELDVTRLDDTILGHTDPFWQFIVESEGPADPDWSQQSLDGRYPEICGRVLLVKSFTEPWEDPADIWRGLRTQGCTVSRNDHRLIVTPEEHTHHLSLLSEEVTPVGQQMLDFLDGWLKDEEAPELPLVQLRAPTDAEYRSALNWPAGDVSYDLYLANAGTDPSNGLLLREAPEENLPGSFTFDPASMNTCEEMPFLGFVGDTLTGQLTLAGAAEVELYVTNSTPDADYVAMLYDYRADSDDPFVFVTSGGLRARYRNGFETAAPMSPNELTSLAFELTSVAYTFDLHSRVVLIITSTPCQMSKNPHTGESYDAQTQWLESTYTIFHDTSHPSRLSLPVLEPPL